MKKIFPLLKSKNNPKVQLRNFSTSLKFFKIFKEKTKNKLKNISLFSDFISPKKNLFSKDQETAKANEKVLYFHAPSFIKARNLTTSLREITSFSSTNAIANDGSSFRDSKIFGFENSRKKTKFVGKKFEKVINFDKKVNGNKQKMLGISDYNFNDSNPLTGSLLKKHQTTTKTFNTQETTFKKPTSPNAQTHTFPTTFNSELISTQIIKKEIEAEVGEEKAFDGKAWQFNRPYDAFVNQVADLNIGRKRFFEEKKKDDDKNFNPDHGDDGRIKNDVDDDGNDDEDEIMKRKTERSFKWNKEEIEKLDLKGRGLIRFMVNDGENYEENSFGKKCGFEGLECEKKYKSLNSYNNHINLKNKTNKIFYSANNSNYHQRTQRKVFLVKHLLLDHNSLTQDSFRLLSPSNLVVIKPSFLDLSFNKFTRLDLEVTLQLSAYNYDLAKQSTRKSFNDYINRYATISNENNIRYNHNTPTEPSIKLIDESFYDFAIYNSELLALNLSHNGLHFISPNSFHHSEAFFNLQHLDLSSNNLKTLSKCTFVDLFNLKTLNLSQNSLLTIHPFAFVSTAFVSLGDNDNPLSADFIDNLCLREEDNIEDYNFNFKTKPQTEFYNEFMNDTTLNDMASALKEYEEEGSQVVTPQYCSTHKWTHLSVIDLSHNRLESLQELLFKGALCGMKHLYLHHNRLRHLPRYVCTIGEL